MTAAAERTWVGSDPAAKTVLVADDDKAVCELYELILRKEGFRVDLANDGDAALERLKSRARPAVDLVVLDLMMPGPGGYEVLEEMRKAVYQDVPVLIVTSRPLDPFARNMIMMENNVCGIWRKPFDPARFRRQMHLLLGTAPHSHRTPHGG